MASRSCYFVLGMLFDVAEIGADKPPEIARPGAAGFVGKSLNCLAILDRQR